MTRTIEEHNPLLEAALAYARRGWFVIPLEPGGKLPLTDALPLQDPTRPPAKDNRRTWKPWAERAATEDEIRDWYAAYPLANIGVVAGPSGLLIVDIDPMKSGQWSAEDLGLVEPTSSELDEARARRRDELREREGFDPTGLVSRTPSGGWHLYYRHPCPPLRPVSQRKHSRSPGVDVQAEVHYVVAPPSRNTAIPSHPAYVWVETGEPGPTPAWTIADEADETAEARSIYSGQGAWRSRVLGNRVPEGGDPDRGINGRNQSLRSLALSFARRSVPLDEATEILMCWNEARCSPPLPVGDVIRQVSVMYGHWAREASIDMDDRIALRLRSPDFPVELLQDYPIIYTWAQAVSASRRCNLDYCAFSALMGLGVAATGRYTIVTIDKRGHKWTPATNMWGMAVDASGTGKSQPFKEIIKALAPTGEALGKIADKFNAAVTTRREILQARKREAQKHVGKGGANEVAAQEIIQAVNTELVALPPSLPSHWHSSDATPEALIDRAAALGWHVAMSDEGDEVLTRFFGHYGGKSNISAMLKLWERGQGINERIGRGTTVFKDIDGSMFVATQPSVLGALGQTEALDRGWLARTLFCIPRDPNRVAEAHHANDKDAIERRYAKLLRAVYYGGQRAAFDAERMADDYQPPAINQELCITVADHEDEEASVHDDEDDPKRKKKKRKVSSLSAMTIPRSDQLTRPVLRERFDLICEADAFEPAEQFRERMLERAQEGGEHYTISGAARKAHDYALRIAAMLMLADTWGEGRKIERHHVEVGVALMERYFLRCQYVALDMIAQPPEAKDAIHLVQVMRASGIHKITTVEVEKRLSCRTSTANAVLEWLERQQVVTLKKIKRTYEATLLDAVSL